MWVNMLELRDKGLKLSAAELRARTPFTGWLRLERGHERWGKRTREALLVDPVRCVTLALLYRAEVDIIERRGLVIVGVEEVFDRRGKNREVFRQAWWCWPAQTPAPNVTKRPDGRSVGAAAALGLV